MEQDAKSVIQYRRSRYKISNEMLGVQDTFKLDYQGRQKYGFADVLRAVDRRIGKEKRKPYIVKLYARRTK